MCLNFNNMSQIKYPLLWLGDCFELMDNIDDKSIDLIYCDPPYFCNVDKKFEIYFKTMNEYLDWIIVRITKMKRILKDAGSIYIHLDWHAVHYVKIEMDKIFGYNNLINEIIWWYSGGASQKRTLAKKHDNILFYAKDSNKYIFNADDIRVPYEGNGGYQNSKGIMNNGKRYLPNPLGKIPEDIWKIPIIHPNDKLERIGYPTQKPEKLLEIIIKASSNENDIILDPMMGSGTTGAVCQKLNRKFIGMDTRKESINTVIKRLRILHD